MSELSGIIANVQAIASDLNTTSNAIAAYRKQIVQYTAFIVAQIDGTKQTGIKDCLAALRTAIDALQTSQTIIGEAVGVANRWIENNGGSGSNSPFSGRSMTYGYEPEEVESNHKRR